MTPIERLQKFIKPWGGKLRKVSINELYSRSLKLTSESSSEDFYYPCPFDDAGIDWCRRVIFYADSTKTSSLIHEMGHCFASEVNPSQGDEVDFLGWEGIRRT